MRSFEFEVILDEISDIHNVNEMTDEDCEEVLTQLMTKEGFPKEDKVIGCVTETDNGWKVEGKWFEGPFDEDGEGEFTME